jgi:hypothetical protein
LDDGADAVVDPLVLAVLTAALRHFFGWPWHLADGLGDGLGDGDRDAFGATAGLVVGLARGAGAGAVVRAAAVVRRLAGAGAAVVLAGVTTVNVVAGGACGVGVTSTWRVRGSWPPNVDGSALSGCAWKPTSASSPVAAVASATISTLGSSGPRWCAGAIAGHLRPVWGTDISVRHRQIGTQTVCV